MADDDSDDAASRQARRTASANTGNIRYGTRGEDYTASRSPFANWQRNFQNQERVMRNIYRNYRNGSR